MKRILCFTWRMNASFSMSSVSLVSEDSSSATATTAGACGERSDVVWSTSITVVLTQPPSSLGKEGSKSTAIPVTESEHSEELLLPESS